MLVSCLVKILCPVNISRLRICADFKQQSKLQGGSNLVSSVEHCVHSETSWTSLDWALTMNGAHDFMPLAWWRRPVALSALTTANVTNVAAGSTTTNLSIG